MSGRVFDFFVICWIHLIRRELQKKLQCFTNKTSRFSQSVLPAWMDENSASIPVWLPTYCTRWLGNKLDRSNPLYSGEIHSLLSVRSWIGTCVVLSQCMCWLGNAVMMSSYCTVWLGRSSVLLLISSTASLTAPSSGEWGDGNITPERTKRDKSYMWSKHTAGYRYYPTGVPHLDAWTCPLKKDVRSAHMLPY